VWAWLSVSGFLYEKFLADLIDAIPKVLTTVSSLAMQRQAHQLRVVPFFATNSRASATTE
jgi:hypothetical protein